MPEPFVVDLKLYRGYLDEGLAQCRTAAAEARQVLEKSPEDPNATLKHREALRAEKAFQSAINAIEACCPDLPTYGN